jgi:hypothetical protein
MSENITIHEIGYIIDGINHVLKLPGYVDMGMTKEYAETHPKELHDVTMVKVLDWIRKNCEIRLKSIKKRNGTKKKGKK